MSGAGAFRRAAGAMASLSVRLIMSGGIKRVVVDARLAEMDARFARDNEWIVRPGRAFDRQALPAGAGE